MVFLVLMRCRLTAVQGVGEPPVRVMEQVAPPPQFKRGVGGKVQGPLGVDEAAGEARPYQPCCHAGTLHLQAHTYVLPNDHESLPKRC